MKPLKKKINKQRLKDDREELARRRVTFKAYGGKMTIFYHVPDEFERAKEALRKVMTDPFALKRKIAQLARRKEAQKGSATSCPESFQFDFFDQDTSPPARSKKGIL